MQEDLSQRDLSDKRVQDMTRAERLEMKRRFQEFVAMVRGSGQPPATAAPQQLQRWDPRAHGAKSLGKSAGAPPRARRRAG